MAGWIGLAALVGVIVFTAFAIWMDGENAKRNPTPPVRDDMEN